MLKKRIILYMLMPGVGFEPTTSRLWVLPSMERLAL